MFYKKVFLFLFILLAASIFSPQTTLAADCSNISAADGSGATELCNPLGDGATPQTLIGKIINAAMGIVGSIALLMFIYGGFVWMTAAGNEQSVTKGRDILIWATVGLIIIFSSYALVKFVFKGLGVG